MKLAPPSSDETAVTVSQTANALEVPRPWSTGDLGSFAWDTLKRRVPEILADVRRRMGPVPADVNAALDDLDAEIRRGTLRGLRESAPDREAWDAATAPHVGRSWLDIPWYFAESYFYRRILEATGYFGRGPMAGKDPYTAHKNEEWAAAEGPRRTADLLASAPSETTLRLEALLLGSLWGNRADLSYNVARELGSLMGETHDLVANDTVAVANHLMQGRPRVCLIADNAGTECLLDLALIDHLLDKVGMPFVELHLKNHPFFVSDTMPSDIPVALAALANSGREETVALGQRLEAHLGSGRLALWSHPFYTSSGFYRQLPRDLRERLAGFGLVILKGDANYRRLLSDAPWPPETNFA
ncbi:MAG TPA: damage-control phosphatase ARMT1 family protein, partial [Polyangia bacterium]